MSGIATEAVGLDSLHVASHGWSDKSRTQTECGVPSRNACLPQSRHMTREVKCLIHVAAVVHT